MSRILSVDAASPFLPAVRDLFLAYREFLATIASTHCFNFQRFAEETAALPAWYTGENGELLLALLDQPEPETPAACIAFRAAPGEPATTCEMKRLFVLPRHRRQGLARLLISEVLVRATAHGFTRVILDTDIHSMPAAHATYLNFGFREYIPAHGQIPPTIRYLERCLP